MRSRAVSLPRLVLALDRRRRAGVERLLAQLGELLEPLLDRVRRRRRGRSLVAVERLGLGGRLQLFLFCGHRAEAIGPLAPSRLADTSPR